MSCRVEQIIEGKPLSIEAGRVARQADGAVLVRYGDTVVLTAAVTGPPRGEEIDFFPLSVEYREKHSAAMAQRVTFTTPAPENIIPMPQQKESAI